MEQREVIAVHDFKPIPILLNISVTANNHFLLILLSIFRVGFDSQLFRLCYETIGSCF